MVIQEIHIKFNSIDRSQLLYMLIHTHCMSDGWLKSENGANN